MSTVQGPKLKEEETMNHGGHGVKEEETFFRVKG
jgi:hypothetical protein